MIGLSNHGLNGESVVEIVGGDHHTLPSSGGWVFMVGGSDYSRLGLPEDDLASSATGLTMTCSVRAGYKELIVGRQTRKLPDSTTKVSTSPSTWTSQTFRIA